MTSSALPTRGQLERTLSQRIQAFYRVQLGHQPSRVQCYVTDGKVTIVLEDSITRPEQLLMETGQEQLAEKVRDDLDKALHPQLSALIEEIVGIKVVDIFSDATFDTGRSGTIVVLEEAPQLRESQPKRAREENNAASDE
ncbi:MAG: DUF2294 domain-containing protein [Leptolyngbya sp. Prado105]|jgi:uncharacterized protein YbcI|nr:DUF2294 domain-containing protein [Leptolyngbya sp. Prado105]